jgi:hypothetical protein
VTAILVPILTAAWARRMGGPVAKPVVPEFEAGAA